jgi:hypothetical protein
MRGKPSCSESRPVSCSASRVQIASCALPPLRHQGEMEQLKMQLQLANEAKESALIELNELRK